MLAWFLGKGVHAVCLPRGAQVTALGAATVAQVPLKVLHSLCKCWFAAGLYGALCGSFSCGPGSGCRAYCWGFIGRKCGFHTVERMLGGAVAISADPAHDTEFAGCPGLRQYGLLQLSQQWEGAQDNTS